MTYFIDDVIWNSDLYIYLCLYSEQVISGVAWVNHGVLVVTTGNQVRCYKKWLTTKDEGK